jgi:hypothetical protein
MWKDQKEGNKGEGTGRNGTKGIELIERQQGKGRPIGNEQKAGNQ